MIRPSGDSTRPAIAYPNAKAITARPSRASRERLSRLSRASWRCWSTQCAIASLKSDSGRLVVLIAGQFSLETRICVPLTILNSGWLPVLIAWAASR